MASNRFDGGDHGNYETQQTFELDLTIRKSMVCLVDSCENNRKGLAATHRIQKRKVLAEREGFEPPVPVKARTLSRRLVSTTHPSLRAFAS